MKKEQIESRKAFIINTLFFALVIAIIWIGFKYVLSWFMPFIIGFAIAALFNPAIRLLEKRIRIGRKAVASIVVILGYAVLVTILTLLTLQVVSLLKHLFTAMPDYVNQKILPSLMSLDFSLDSLVNVPPEWHEQIKAIQQSLTEGLTKSISSLSAGGLTLVTNITKGVPTFLVTFVFTILASFFLSFQYDKSKRFIALQLPEKVRILAREVKSAFSETILRYMRGYLKIMLITFVELSIGLTIIGVKNSVAVALGIALFDIFPVFGTGGIVIPWALIELLGGNLSTGMGLLIIYGIITVIRNFIEPKIIGDQLGLNPVISLISIYLGFVWIGVAGMILMPISVQIAISLHRKGIIKLYKEEPISADSIPTTDAAQSFSAGKGDKPDKKGTLFKSRPDR